MISIVSCSHLCVWKVIAISLQFQFFYTFNSEICFQQFQIKFHFFSHFNFYAFSPCLEKRREKGEHCKVRTWPETLDSCVCVCGCVDVQSVYSKIFKPDTPFSILFFFHFFSSTRLRRAGRRRRRRLRRLRGFIVDRVFLEIYS